MLKDHREISSKIWRETDFQSVVTISILCEVQIVIFSSCEKNCGHFLSPTYLHKLRKMYNMERREKHIEARSLGLSKVKTLENNWQSQKIPTERSIGVHVFRLPAGNTTNLGRTWLSSCSVAWSLRGWGLWAMIWPWEAESGERQSSVKCVCLSVLGWNKLWSVLPKCEYLSGPTGVFIWPYHL